MTPRLLLVTFAAIAASVGCGDDNRPPALALVLDQQVTVGESLRLVLSAEDPDGDPLAFSARGLPKGALLTPRSATEAVLTYSPLITDTQPGGRRYDVTLEAADGEGGVARQRFGLLVFPTFGVPTFDLPSGVVLNLAQEDDLDLAVTVKDDDSTDVTLTLVEGPAGAKLAPESAKRAHFHWRPDDAQRQIAVHRAVFSALDESHEAVTHVLTLVLLNGEKQSGCSGTPPTVQHAIPADGPLSGDLALGLDARDADSLVQSATVHWTRGAPTGAFSAATLTRAGSDSPTWSAAVAVGAPASGGTLVHYYFTTTDNDDPTGLSCDQTARTPKTGWFTLAVYPPGSPASACADDAAEPDDTAAAAPLLAVGVHPGRRLCGATSDLARLAAQPGERVSATVQYEPSHGALSLRLRDASGATLATASASGDGALTASTTAPAGEVFAEVSASAPSTRLSYTLAVAVDAVSCANDALEPNDAPEAARALGLGDHEALEICGGDQDFFRLTTAPGVPLEVLAFFEHRYGDLDLELRALDGVTVLATAASEKSIEELTYTSPSGGDVLLRVYGVGGARNAYALAVRHGDASQCPADPLGDNHAPEDAVVLFSGIYEGFTVCGETPDWFAVDLNGGETLEVLAEGEGGAAPPGLAIFTDPTAGPVATSAPGDDFSDVVYTASNEPQRLYYRVTTAAAASPYVMLQDVADPAGACAPDRLEPNSAGAPVALPQGITTWLRLCGDGDLDAFSFEVPPFTLVTAITGHATGRGFTDLRLLGPDGTELSAATDPQDGAFVEVLVEAGGVYRLQVEPYQVGSAGLGYDVALFFE